MYVDDLFLTEEEKRRKASGFAAVGFTYESSASAKAEPAAMNSNMSLPEHPPTSCVDDNEEDAFIPPPGLIIPEEIQPVCVVVPSLEWHFTSPPYF